MIELEEAKIHLQMEDDETENDRLIEGLIPVAKIAVENYINRKVYGTQDELDAAQDSTGIVADEGIIHGIKLFLTHFIENPSVTSERTVKDVPNLKYLLDSYRLINV